MSLYEAFVTVRPDMDGFPEELKVKVHGAAEAAKAKVKIESELSPRLNSDIAALHAKIAALGAEYQRTGKVDLRKNIAEADRELSRLVATARSLERSTTGVVGGAARQAAAQAGAAASAAAQAAEQGIVAAFKRAGPAVTGALGTAIEGSGRTGAIAGAIAAGIVVGGPLIGTALSSVIGGVVTGGFLAGGIALAFQDPKVRAAGGDMAHAIGVELQGAAVPFTDRIAAAIPYLEQKFAGLRPVFADVFADLAPQIDTLAAGLAGALQGAVGGGGLQDLIASAKPFIDVLGEAMPEIGQDLNNLFGTIAEHKEAALAFFQGMLDLTQASIDLISLLVGVAGDMLDVFLDVDIKVVDTVLKVAKGIEFLSPAAAAAVVPLQGISDELSRMKDTGQAVPPVMDRLTDSVVSAATAAKGFRDSASAIGSGLGDLSAAADARASVVSSFFGATADRAESADRATADFLAAQDDMARRVVANGRAVVAAQRDVAHASESVAGAEQSLRAAQLSRLAAQRGELGAEKDLITARRTALEQLQQLRNAVRDLADNEEAARIRLIEAQAQVRQTSGLPTSNIDRRKALLGLDEAQHNLTDVLAQSRRTRLDAARAEAKGVDNADTVVAAQQRVKDAHEAARNALIGVTTAQHGVRDADQALTDSRGKLGIAQAENSRTLDLNTKAGRDNAAAIQNQVDKAKAELTQNLKNNMLWPEARRIYEERLAAIKTEDTQLGYNKDSVQALIDKYGEMPPEVNTLVNLIGAPEAATQIDNLFKSVKDFAGLFGVDLAAAAALKPGQPGFIGPVRRRPAIDLNDPRIAPFLRRAGGGPVWGAGTDTSDSIPTLLSNDEHVLSAAEVRGLGGHGTVEAMRRAAVGRYATGGRVIPRLLVNQHLDAQTSRITGPAFAAVASALAAGSGGGLGGAYAGPVTDGNSINEIIMAAKRSGIPYTVTAESYDTPGFYHSNNGGYHSKHEAVDFGNFRYGQAVNDRLAAWFAATYGSKLRELIHTRGDGQTGWYIKDGRSVSGPGFYGRGIMAQHVNHVHVAALPGFSTGAAAPPAGSTGGINSVGGLFGTLLSRIAASGGGGGGSVPSSGDLDVARSAFQTARAMGADHKVLLALFEAGIVESGMRNLAYGDRDSLGYLQQRPSMGWPNPRNVPVATASFVRRAIANEGRYATSGQLAQSVQRSAYPGKYDGVAGAAEALLARTSAGVFDQGGMLHPGQVGVNLSSGVEAVLDPDESRGLKAAVKGGPVELGDDSIRRLVVGIVQAIQTRPHTTEIDGRVVAEVTRGHLEQSFAVAGMGV